MKPSLPTAIAAPAGALLLVLASTCVPTSQAAAQVPGHGLAPSTGAEASAAGATDSPQRREGKRTPDVVFVPTPHEVVDEMLRVAAVGPDDVLYDLGSGDGRIPIAAAKRWGTRGVGIDIDPQRIREANRAAKQAGVSDRVEFVEGDLFDADLSKATVITLYLLPRLNLKLRPKLLQLEPGTRIVSHDFDMGDWKPERTTTVGDSTVYFWTVPETPPEGLD